MNKNIPLLTFIFLCFCFSSKGQVGAISGPTGVCVGMTISLTDGTIGGAWTSSPTSVATVGVASGIVGGVAPGTATISYTAASGVATYVITVYPNPAAISGGSAVCQGGTLTLSDVTGGGVWTSTPTSVATVGATGIVSGVTSGTATISYTVGTCSATKVVTVNPQPAPITGIVSTCTTWTDTLLDATPGGTWSSSTTTVATVGTSGVVYGVALGTSVITYRLGTGCYTTLTVSVNTLPGPITGGATVCKDTNLTLADGGSGVWSSSNTTVATITSSTGIVRGVSIGTTIITYLFSTGCFVTETMTVTDCNNICPPNINFEFGNLAYWNFYHGSVSNPTPTTLLFSLAPVAATPGYESLTPDWSGPGTQPYPTPNKMVAGVDVDYYGGFPVVGAGNYSCRLGNELVGAQAERARYYVTVPTGSANYSLIYRYAVVFENPAGHSYWEQPSFHVNAYNAATGDTISCAQYTYVSSASLPGFNLSSQTSRNDAGAAVYYHSWATSSINLSGLGGATIYIDFTAGDCTLTGHFGYGYLDMTCGLFSINSISCNDTNVTLTAPTGFANYSWYDSSTFSPLLGTGITVTLPMPPLPTTFAVIITPYPGFGCPDTLYSHVIPTRLQIHKMHDTTICIGSTVALSSGATDIALPLSYAWSPSAALSCNTCASPVVTPTVFGTVMYTFTVTDVAGCTQTDSIKINTVGVTLTTSVTNATCHGYTDGTATVVPTHGTPPFTYVWSTFPVQTTSVATGLGRASYTVTVTDNGGCSRSAVVSILDSPALIINLGPTAGPTTCQGNDGYIKIGSSNGSITPATTYQVTFDSAGIRVTHLYRSTTADTLILDNLAKGIYDSIKIVKPGCQYNEIGPVVLRDPAPPAPPIISNNSPVCLRGTVELIVTDITPGVSYNWTGPAGLARYTPPSASNSDTVIRGYAPYAFAGTYVITVTKANCTVVDSTTVVINPRAVPTASNNSSICSGDTLKLMSSSATGANSFRWAGPAGYTSREQNPVIPNAQVIANGPFKVFITLNGCIDSAVTNVYVIQTPSAPLVGDTAYCQFATNVAPLNVAGIGLWWYPSPVGGAGSTTPPAISTAKAGTTTWYVSQKTATTPVCEGPRAPVSVVIYAKPNPSLAVMDSLLCRGNQVMLNATSIGEANTGITWNFGNGDSIVNANPVMHSFDAEGTYTVSVNAYYKVCPHVTLTKPVTVYSYPDLYLGADTAICPGGEPLVLRDVLNEGRAGANWVWNTGDVGPELVIRKPGMYYTVVTINGCSSTDTVIVRNDCYLDIPNVFTPNNDGVNDYFFPRQFLTKGLISFRMNIYNRWGEMIYQSQALDGRGWDGSYNGVPQPEGVFVYIIDAVFKDGQKEHHQGNITLMR
jgi:gliding motility-associated-like protein